MVKRKYWMLMVAACLSASLALGQGLDTTAEKDDWEEINFEFDSSILTDGYPSLLRLADLLSANSDYKVELVGHTDFRGSDEYNTGLGLRRSETVKSFLTKYGASDGQITIRTLGEGVPKVGNETDEGRFMNRRVVMEVRDGDGNLVSDGGVGEAIDGIERLVAAQEDCCNQILEKLNKLDEILDLLKGLQDENDQLKQDVAALKDDRPAVMKALDDTRQVAENTPRQVEEVVTRRLEEEASNKKKYASFNAMAGPSSPNGNLSVSGTGRVFVPFAKRHAVQAQGEFMHFLGRDEGQVDLGLVNRWGDFQAGGFTSFKYVKFDEWQRAGGLGQAAVTLDYVFDTGRVGFFGTKAFADGAIVNEALIRRNIMEQTYLQVVDQAGISAAVSAWDVGKGYKSWFEGNAGALFRRGGSNKPGGTLRYIHPLTRGLALTLEGGVNETLVSNNTTGRFVVGLQFGGWLSPDKYADMGDKPVPVDVPRVRYEVLTRELRTGNDSPVADAGFDQTDVQPGVITLDGSGSFDPDEDPITYEWTQIGGPTVGLTGADAAQATFTAEEGQTYQFRLTVRDDQGGVGTDRTMVSADSNEIDILSFTVDPSRADSGETVTLAWEVNNADSVTIEPGLGGVENIGTARVQVFETTTYTLTATKADRVVTQTRTVEVDSMAPSVLTFTATPMTIESGDSTVLAWETLDADQVDITVQSGDGQSLGSVGVSGTATVSPRQTTTYGITASNRFGETTRTVTVTVLSDAPRILNFVATPQEIDPGEFSTLVWEVEGADEVSISPALGGVDSNGSSDVQPMTDTTYTLTARNEHGEVSQSVVVAVREQVRIIEFKSSKTTVQNPGEPAVLSWVTENATRVELVNFGEVAADGSQEVNPVGTTLYTLIAYGENSQVQATVTLNVENENQGPIAIAEGPTAILVPAGTLTGTGTLDGSKSYDPDGDPITFEWRSVGEFQATILTQGAAKPTVRFDSGYGIYEFELMVTDDKGAMSFDSVRVPWVDP